jgi:hypothetical protein
MHDHGAAQSGERPFQQRREQDRRHRGISELESRMLGSEQGIFGAELNCPSNPR